ncbi:hypothetical protein [Methanobrevibacter sp.]|uniref:hypothetical protein n=1 Tax=Methanobrevibacter sp. TaxID=66852 RepID=UPI002E787521|nr:hypothetical protein [Methanobrevibacter sp.]MEE1337213.1 hypothetical protein [Methanobrevibacter sp.]
MKKLLLIVLIFMLMGAVCAHDDTNGTAGPVLGDTEYTSSIDDDGKTLEVGEGDYIPIGLMSISHTALTSISTERNPQSMRI